MGLRAGLFWVGTEGGPAHGRGRSVGSAARRCVPLAREHGKGWRRGVRHLTPEARPATSRATPPFHRRTTHPTLHAAPGSQFADFKSYEGIRDALLAGSSQLGLDHLSLLMQIVPSEDEAKSLLAYAGPVEELSPPERFMRLMATVPRAVAKVGALMFRLQFAALCGDAAEGMAAVREAGGQVLASARLKKASAVGGEERWRSRGRAGTLGVRGVQAPPARL